MKNTTLKINNFVNKRNYTSIILSLLILFIFTSSKLSATNSVNIKTMDASRAGSQGSVFYSSERHQNVSKKMHPLIQSPEKKVNASWDSVTYSPEEAYIKLEKKIYKNQKPANVKKLTFADIANQF
jgi:hypothetical protein